MLLLVLMMVLLLVSLLVLLLALLLALLLVLLLLLLLLTLPPSYSTMQVQDSGKGGSVCITVEGWQVDTAAATPAASALLLLLICAAVLLPLCLPAPCLPLLTAPAPAGGHRRRGRR